MPTSTDSVDQFVKKLEIVRGSNLSPEDQAEVELWHKGRALRHLVGAYGWEVLLEILQSYPQDAIHQLLRIPPGDERVIAAHAAAYALNDFYVKFREDIDRAVEASNTLPTAVREGVKVASAVPPESL